MVFFIANNGFIEFLGCAKIGFPWPDGKDWLPIEVRTAWGWIVIEKYENGENVLVCPD